MNVKAHNTNLPVFATTGKSFMVSNGWVNQLPLSSGSAIPGSASANKVYLIGFQLTQPITIKNILIYLTAASAGTHAGFGIYDVNGNLVVDSGPISLAGSVGAINTTLGTAVTLGPDFYYFAQTADSLTPTVIAMNESTIGSSTAVILNSSGSNMSVSATNASVAGQLPSTTGALVATTQQLVMPFVLFRA